MMVRRESWQERENIGVMTVLRGIVMTEILGSKSDQWGVQFLHMTQFGMQGWNWRSDAAMPAGMDPAGDQLRAFSSQRPLSFCWK